MIPHHARFASRLLGLALCLLPILGHAADQIPDCLDDAGDSLSVMNDQVCGWKQSKPTQWKERALISGTFVAITMDRDSHFQFSIQIGPDARKDLVEVVYNKVFGAYPTPFPGMKVSACGDFINAKSSSGGYSASPVGAIIHWVHLNPGDRGSSHPSGFIVMDGKLVGQDYSGVDNR